MQLTTKYSLTQKTKEEIFSSWLFAVKNHECASILHLPKRDQLYRLQAFLESKEIIKKYLPNFHQYQFIVLDLAGHPLDDESELTLFLKQKIDLKKQYHVLLILDADELLYKKKHLLPFLDGFYRQKNISILYFFRTNITYSWLSKTISPFTTLYQNIFIFPFLKEEDSFHFLNYLEKKYQTKIPFSLKNQIVNFCGGISLLIEQIVRYYCRTKDEKNLFDHEEIRLKLQIVWNEFDDLEKNCLEKIVKKQKIFNDEDKEILQYLAKTNTVIKRKNDYQLHSSLLEKFIKTLLKNKLKIELDGQRDILINGVFMNNYFSKRERIFLIYLLKNKGKIISREEAGKIIWQNSADYNEWSLDQFISRLRKKLISLGFEKNIIQTLKNQGFVLP